MLIDGKPLFTFYDLGNFVAQQGGVEGAKETIRRMREAVVAAGFPGIWIVAETRNIDPNAFYIMETIGLDASFPYCVPVLGGMENDEAIASIIATSEKIDAVSKLPSIATASVSWAVQPWIEYIDYPWPSQPWWINPPHYRTLLEKMKARIDARPGNNPLAKKVLLIDNWNEYAEGHWVAPPAKMASAISMPSATFSRRTDRNHRMSCRRMSVSSRTSLLIRLGWKRCAPRSRRRRSTQPLSRTGKPFGTHIPAMYGDNGEHRRLGSFMMAINLEMFGGGEMLAHVATAMAKEARIQPLAGDAEEVQVPGDPEYRTQEKRSRDGIPIEPGLLEEMQTWSQTLGVAMAFAPDT